MGTTPTLIVHRSTNEIGGNCIEVAFVGQWIILDAGSRLSDQGEADSDELRRSFDVELPTEALILSQVCLRQSECHIGARNGRL
jgi:hypothetical protein